MKTILQPLKPLVMRDVLEGRKTILFEKTKPQIDGPFKVLLYCSTPKNTEHGILLNPYATKMTGRTATEKYLFRNRSRIGEEGTLWEGMIDLQDRIVGEYVCKDVNKLVHYGEGVCRPLHMVDEATQIPVPLGIYAWNVSNLIVYDKPKSLSEFHGINKKVLDVPKRYVYVEE